MVTLIYSCANCFIFRLVKMDPPLDNQDDAMMAIINDDNQYNPGADDMQGNDDVDDESQYINNYSDGQENVLQEIIGEVY